MKEKAKLGDRYLAAIEKAPTAHNLTPEQRALRAAKKDLDQALLVMATEKKSVEERQRRLAHAEQEVAKAAARHGELAKKLTAEIEDESVPPGTAEGGPGGLIDRFGWGKMFGRRATDK